MDQRLRRIRYRKLCERYGRGNNMNKIVLTSFVFVLMTHLAFADEKEFGKEKVAKMWPYPEKIVKVIAANANIEKDGKTVRMADVVTKSKTTGTCSANRTQFVQSGSGWQFGEIEESSTVSCKTLKVVSSGSGSGSSADPRDHAERGLGEADRTLSDVENTANTARRIRNIGGIF